MSISAPTEISRVPPTVNLDLYAGDGVGIKFTAKDSDGNPYPLDGAIAAQIKTKRTDVDPLATWGVDASQQSGGIVTLSLSGSDTASLIPEGKTTFGGVWDMQYTPTGSDPMTLLQGKVTCAADVTH